MSIEPNSQSSHLQKPKSVVEQDLQPDDFEDAGGNSFIPDELATQQVLSALASVQSPQNTTALKQARSIYSGRSIRGVTAKPRALLVTF
ncbi:MAG: pentapeptide repeat-containing protein, partial [Calothrix sp. SM1_7_51]|nr:pentapeptide repeat-containing protein [Calothrix sp. SM1_7_51]